VAWATGIAKVTGKAKTGNVIDSPTFETDVFEKHDGHWLLVSHTGLQVTKEPVKP
jgi:hypothetical protein